jgi:TRAP-type C4-dicarboxylate transport system permease small subunit
MQRFIQIVDKIETVLSTLLLSIIVLLVFFASLLRYLGFPINGADTIAAALFVWLIYIGADQVLRKDRHLGVDYFTQRLPGKMKNLTSLVVLLVMLVFLVLVTYVGMSLVIANNGRILGDLPVSYAFVTMAVPVGSFLMCLTTITKILVVMGNFEKTE